ncbi:RNA polymerase, sigma 32 subunit, RpoH [Nitrosospira sp. Nsp18]|uniref:RNA polymerase sigma factor RpoH n=1 Tax=Nitrosospira sp. Nsp18 TaxID=1855334 RepID=UPI00088D6B4C|nr:RNA polymerase sigma factor RpoH [Nitrosospira sp. Nsp18]SDA16605.1 RNA polymerase, sigma 32 subunit, RpoH [Nitrosospira sp. Nsp18]
MNFALAIPSAGSIESYIQSANRFGILSQEEEIRLARSLRDEDNIDAARQLVLSHLRVVIAIARGYKGYGLPQADLIQEGNIGLMKAVKRYDPERGVRLVSFAVHWIKAEIHEFILRNWRLVRIATTKAQRKLFFNLRSMKPVLDTMNPEEVSAMAKQLGVKVEEVVEMETRFSGRDISLEPLSDEDDDEAFSPIAYLTDGSEPRQLLEAEENTRLRGEGLEQALSGLDTRSRRIIEARWLREKDPATLHDLAGELGVSAERIRQIEAKAMQKMRAALAPSV